MKSVLPLFVFIDACGWEIIKGDPFGHKFAPLRKRLDSVFGYSSACVPSILSGRWPDEHRNWSYFVYDPENSPFKMLRALRWLPTRITSRRIFRRWLSKFIKVHLSFRGYFDLYNIPFEHISKYDFTEKKSPLQAGGMNRGPNIFDYLEQEKIAYHVSQPDKGEEENLAALIEDVEQEKLDFAFLYWPGLDGLLHRVGNKSTEVPAKLRLYEQWLEKLMNTSSKHYEEVRLYVFSDHGMANCDELLDLKKPIEALPLTMGEDYAVVYDSTMARFWFLKEGAREKIEAALGKVPQGRIVPEAELREMRTFFADGHFGQLIFVVKEGVLIVPSHMGERPIKGMHGYHPGEKQSYAMVCTNQPGLPEDVRAIPDIYKLMVRDATLARDRNSPGVGREKHGSLAVAH